MAVRHEDLLVREAIVYRFPTGGLRARAARRRMIARRRMTFGVVAVMTAGFLLAGGPEGSATASKAGSPAVVTVRPGDTLWGIAARFAPDSVDPRVFVDALESVNSLQGPIHPGLRLKLP